MLWPQQADLLSQFFVNLSAVADRNPDHPLDSGCKEGHRRGTSSWQLREDADKHALNFGRFRGLSRRSSKRSQSGSNTPNT